MSFIFFQHCSTPRTSAPNIDFAHNARKSYSVDFKLKAVEYAKTHTQKEAAEKFGVAVSRVCTWLRSEDMLRMAAIQNLEVPGRKEPILKIFEEDLLKWLTETLASGQTVTMEDFQNAARDIFQANLASLDQGHIGETADYNMAFYPSSSWVKGFMKKNKLGRVFAPMCNSFCIVAEDTQAPNQQEHFYA